MGCSHQDSGSQTSYAVELRFSVRQHPGTVWVNNSCNIICLLTNAFHIGIKQVQNGTLYKGNNDVAKGFIGCQVVSIMILPVQYAFFGPVH